ncbi:hypothetical protein KP509_07G022800 [Ceratopteris richardii]|uniref:Uncharacterized protein n=1 Tax=Ceratopteris richardii TaxID=49495 RepID=A0A8T2UGJ1_CERRI|nr:hypothetical protein KP509_07G022800 [Ceratopteris richardii]
MPLNHDVRSMTHSRARKGSPLSPKKTPIKSYHKRRPKHYHTLVLGPSSLKKKSCANQYKRRNKYEANLNNGSILIPLRQENMEEELSSILSRINILFSSF